jgi:hypothetical protein
MSPSIYKTSELLNSFLFTSRVVSTIAEQILQSLPLNGRFKENAKSANFLRDFVRDEANAATSFMTVSTILCKFDKGANWAAPFLSGLLASSIPSLTI